ncbi:MAG: haloalkane dehalogenase [Pseudooceanicola sp.]
MEQIHDLEPPETDVPADFPYVGKTIDLYGSKLFYVDEGTGDPILFLHGNPNSSYCWRNVIAGLADKGRCIAPDFIGFGQSDKPDLEYRIFDHIRFIEEFIVQLDLSRLTLVLHDWGAFVGLDIARRFPERIKRIAFFEFAVSPPETLRETWPLMADDFEKMRDPAIGPELLIKQNLMVEASVPMATMRKLSDAEMDAYRAPFPTHESRRAMARLPRDLSFAGDPADTSWVIARYSDWLCETPLPKLLIHATPGMFIPADKRDWALANYRNVEDLDLGAGVFMLMEDHPKAMSDGIADWMRRTEN